jgi:hypothetical protein
MQGISTTTKICNTMSHVKFIKTNFPEEMIKVEKQEGCANSRSVKYLHTDRRGTFPSSPCTEHAPAACPV